jgi:hypothetical protein
MRKIEQQMINALKTGNGMTGKNTTVSRCDAQGEQWVYLHGNIIAHMDHKQRELTLTLAGWNTVTTRSRLNALSRVFGGDRFSQKDFTPYYGDSVIDDRDMIGIEL